MEARSGGRLSLADVAPIESESICPSELIGGIEAMAGMGTSGSTSSNGYDNRTVSIEVSALSRQDVMKTSNYTVKIPHCRMMQTIQGIHRVGGQIASVSVLSES